MNNNTWIPWDEREDLPERFALLTVCACKDGTTYSHLSPSRHLFLLPQRSIPEERIEQVKARILSYLKLLKHDYYVFTLSGKWECAENDFSIEFPTLKELGKEDALKVYSLKRKDENSRFLSCFTTPINQVLAEAEDEDHYQFELSSTGAAQTPGAKKQTKRKPRPGSNPPVQRKTENFKLPKGADGINKLLEILRYLRNGEKQNWIAHQIGFHYTLWNKKGKFGDCLRKLKQQAEQYPDKDKAKDYLFCTALLGEIDEAELAPDKDNNWRERPMGTLDDRDQWG